MAPVWKRVGEWSRRYTEARMTEPAKKRGVPLRHWWGVRFPGHLWLGVGVPLVLVIIGAVSLPVLHEDWMRGNEREACLALEALAVAEANFESNDRNGNKVKDYWTGNVTGLWIEVSHGRQWKA